jgi:hypothetical protein
LVDHFQSTINAISDDSWRHYRIGWRDPKYPESKKKVFVLARADVKELVINHNPKVFFLQYHQLRAKLQVIRDRIVQSLRGFDFITTTPVLQATFPDYLVGETDSGINELFRPPARGRPKKRKRGADIDYILPLTLVRSTRRKTSKRPATHVVVDSSSSDDKKVYAISEIYLEAMDQSQGKFMCLCRGKGGHLQLLRGIG